MIEHVDEEEVMDRIGAPFAALVDQRDAASLLDVRNGLERALGELDAVHVTALMASGGADVAHAVSAVMRPAEDLHRQASVAYDSCFESGGHKPERHVRVPYMRAQITRRTKQRETRMVMYCLPLIALFALVVAFFSNLIVPDRVVLGCVGGILLGALGAIAAREPIDDMLDGALD